MAKGDVIAGSGSLPDSFGRNSVKERINVNERQELPLYMRASSYRPHKEVISVKMAVWVDICKFNPMVCNKNNWLGTIHSKFPSF